MEINPIDLFQEWFREHLEKSSDKLPAACCLSTVGTGNFPNARFVSLKEVTEAGFIITGTLTSRKGIEIRHNPKIALTFWWPETERQVRIQGEVEAISNDLADEYFAQRNRDSCIVSVVSEQGAVLISLEELQEKYDLLDNECQSITRPDNWGGYLVVPERIEFMEFRQTRFHDRTLFEMINGGWVSKQLQP